MNRLTDSEWLVMEALWAAGRGQHLGQLLETLSPRTGWSRTTLHTYLTRMMAKGLVCCGEETPRRYAAAVSREQCAAGQRRDLLERVYQGSAGRMLAAFLRDGSLTREEREELRRLLDEMEV